MRSSGFQMRSRIFDCVVPMRAAKSATDVLVDSPFSVQGYRGLFFFAGSSREHHTEGALVAPLFAVRDVKLD